MNKSRISLGGGTPSINISHGSGVWVWDDKNQKFLDCTSQSWALYLGHAHPEIREHIYEVTGSLWHTHQGFNTEQREIFASRLIDLTNENEGNYIYDRVSPTVSSGLAVETAIKLALINRNTRDKLARLRGGFHGTTLGLSGASWPGQDDVAASNRTLERFARFGPKFESLSFPDTKISIEENIKILDQELDQICDEIAAVIVEPIQGSGGQRELPMKWLEHLRDRAKQDKFLVIYDEIQTYIRAGRYYTDVKNLGPHMICLGKGLAGGLACGATLLRNDLEGFPKSGIFDLHTFSSSALSHSVAVKLLDIVKRDNLIIAAREKGKQLADGLRLIQNKHPIVSEIRQVGLHIGVEFADTQTGMPLAKEAASVRIRALENGLIVGLGGYKPEVLKIKPPLIISEVDIFEILNRLEESIRMVERYGY